MKYQQGQCYEFEVKRIDRDSSGYEFFLVTDGENEYRVYGVLPCQSDDCPDEVIAYVKFVDINGRIKLWQDLYAFIKAHYQIDDVKSFRVSSIDYDKSSRYYWIEDDLMRHRYYFNGEQKYQIGEDIRLKIVGLDSRGFIKFSEISDFIEIPSSSRSVYFPSNTQPIDSQQYILDIGNESTNLELKSSIVFPPGSNGVPDVAKQCHTIIRTLASFMNAEGGDLYIGVHDKTHAVTGIETDYPHLNEDQSDARDYSASQDDFELKIRNILQDRSQSVANELIEFEFFNGGGHDYCVIHVKRSNRPIWVDGNQLYQRVGNRIQMLRGDDINHFVTDRMARPIIESQTQGAQQLNTEKFTQLIRDVLNEQRPHVVAQTASNTTNNPKEWYVWFNDAHVQRFTNREYEEVRDSLQNVYFTLPIDASQKDYLLVLCYASGYINIVTLKDLKGAISKRTKLIDEGYYISDDIKPMSIYLAHPSDMLAGFSVDEHGSKYVKIHSLTDFNPTKHPKNKGVRFVPTTGIITQYKQLPASERDNVLRIIAAKSESSQSFGTPLDSAAYPEQIRFIASYT